MLTRSGKSLVITGGAILGMAAIAFGMVITPGPNMMYLVSRSLTQGRVAGLISLSGVVSGFLIYVGATAAGLSLVFVAVPELFIVFKVAGAIYLLWLAWAMVRGTKSVFRPSADLQPHSPLRLYAMGLTTCLLNPKIALIYAALLPQFVVSHHGNVALQIIELGLVQIVVASLMNSLWVLVAAQMARYLQRRRRAERAVRLAAGGMLAFFAVHLGFANASSR